MVGVGRKPTIADMSQDNSGQSPQPNPDSQPAAPAPTPAPADKPNRLLTREEILRQIREAPLRDVKQIMDAELREAQTARGDLLGGEGARAVGERMRAVAGEPAMRAVGDNRRLAAFPNVTFPFEQKEAHYRECKRQARKHAALGDVFIRWAYADKKRRNDAFDAKDFVKASGRDTKEAEGIVNQMLIQRHFMLVGVDGVEDIEDSVEEATNRAFGSICRLRKQDMVRFTDSGLLRGKQLWWGDRTKWLKPLPRVKKPIWLTVGVIWVIFSGVVGLFGGVRECWKCVRHPIVYFSDDADGQQAADRVKVVAPAASPVITAEPATPTTQP